MSKQSPKKPASAKKSPTKKASTAKKAATVKKTTAAKKSASSKATSGKKAATEKKSISAKKSSTKKASVGKKPTSTKKSSSGRKPAAKKAKVEKKSTASRKSAGSSSEISPSKAAAEAAASSAQEGAKDVSSVPDVSSGGFTLADVRQVLDSKKKSPDEKKAPEPKAKQNAAPKTKEKAQKKKPVKKKVEAASITDILGFNPKKTSVLPDRDESKVPAKLRPYYRSLLKFKSQLMEGLGERSEETIGTSARETSGELSVNSPDAGSESFDRDVALSMVAGEQETLHEVEEAIVRIFNGTYGICQETGKPINQARLKAVPFTRFSLEGQALYEKRGNKDRDSGSGVFANLSEASLGDDQA